MRVSWTARRSNQSILREINPEYSLEELMLKLQYFGHVTQTANLLEKTLMPGKIERKRRGQQGIRLLDCITDSMDMNLSKLQEIVKDRGAWHIAVSMGSQQVGHDLATEQLMERGFPGGASGKEPACQHRRHKRNGSDHRVEKILWRRIWQPTPVFLTGKSHGQRSLVGYSP